MSPRGGPRPAGTTSSAAETARATNASPMLSATKILAVRTSGAVANTRTDLQIDEALTRYALSMLATNSLPLAETTGCHGAGVWNCKRGGPQGPTIASSPTATATATTTWRRDGLDAATCRAPTDTRTFHIPPESTLVRALCKRWLRVHCGDGFASNPFDSRHIVRHRLDCGRRRLRSYAASATVFCYQISSPVDRYVESAGSSIQSGCLDAGHGHGCDEHAGKQRASKQRAGKQWIA